MFTYRLFISSKTITTFVIKIGIDTAIELDDSPFDMYESGLGISSSEGDTFKLVHDYKLKE